MALKLETLIKRGFSGSCISYDKCPRNNQDKNNCQEGPRNKQSEAGIINIIVGRTASGRDSNSGRKKYARQSPSITTIGFDYTEDITFGSHDLEGVSFLHDDALVISAIIANFEVKRILVDNESATNVLSHEAFI